MQTRYVTIGHRRVHLRTAGSGAPVVMLHPSPLSSAALEPLARELAQRYCVIALDTPGYGLSDPLVPAPESLADYLDPLAETLDALGIDACCLYGAATGAQIALEFAKRYPDRIALLVMDSAGHISDADRDRWLQTYFPDVTPRSDGGHLLTWWQMVRDLNLFFPWNEPLASNRIPRDAPAPDALQAVLLEYLRAGQGYATAYRPAFYNESAARLAGLAVPTLLTRWRSSIVLRLTDALIAQGLPSPVEVVELAEGFAGRARGLLEALAARYRGGDCNLPAEVLPIEHVGGAHLRLRDGYDLHVRGRFGGSDRPVVLLHGAGESVRPLEPLTTRVAPQHPVVALDLPGHGGSPGRVEMQTVQELSGLAIAAIDHLGFREAHLVGHELGAQIALEIAARAPGLVRSVLAIGLPLLEPDERPSLHRHYLPDLSPRWDGAHLITAWQMLRDRQLFWPWYQRTQAAAIDADPYLDPTYQQAQTLALLESLETLPGITRSMIDYDSSGAVAQPRCPIVLSAPPSDPFRARITALHAALPHTRRLDLPADPHAWWTPLGETLGALEVIRRGRR